MFRDRLGPRGGVPPTLSQFGLQGLSPPVLLRGLVNRGELVEPPRRPLQELDVDLHGLVEDEDLPPAGPRAVAFERGPGNPVLLEDAEDGGRRDEDLVVRLEEGAEPHCGILAFLPEVEDEGFDLRRDPVGADRRAPGAIAQGLYTALSIPPEPHRELGP